MLDNSENILLLVTTLYTLVIGLITVIQILHIFCNRHKHMKELKRLQEEVDIGTRIFGDKKNFIDNGNLVEINNGRTEITYTYYPKDILHIDVVENGNMESVRSYNFTKDIVKVGRCDCDIIINNHYVSKTHATISVNEGKIFIKNSGRNNTFVDGRIINSDVVEINENSIIRIMDAELRVKYFSTSEVQEGS